MDVLSIQENQQGLKNSGLFAPLHFSTLFLACYLGVMRKGVSMFGKNSAIRKYKYKLRPALAKRYGGSAAYTKAQVDKTIDDLGLNKRHIYYVYLMYCDERTFSTNIPSSETREDMSSTIAAATTFGIIGSLFYSAGDDGGGGSSDGGSDGGE